MIHSKENEIYYSLKSEQHKLFPKIWSQFNHKKVNIGMCKKKARHAHVYAQASTQISCMYYVEVCNIYSIVYISLFVFTSYM